MPNYQETEARNIQEFVALVGKEKEATEKTGNQSDFLFWGQRRDQSLLPKLARLNLRGEITNIEKLYSC